MIDPVVKHLPWFSMQYDGKTVPDEEISIANLIYQTSGFTNNETKFPKPELDMSLEDYIHTLSGQELAFYPSSQYAYANANYAILGLIIEAVSGKSYADFTKEVIFEPFGLHNTYANPDLAMKEGTIIQGSRLSFFSSHPYQVAIRPASIPSGYIISNAKDISRWLQIQLGSIEVDRSILLLVCWWYR